MAVISKKKVAKKNATTFKTKVTKKKVLSAKKDKDTKKKKKDKNIKTEGNELVDKQMKTKAKKRKKKVKGKQKEEDMEEAGPEMASLNQTVEETNSEEFIPITEEGDVATADDSNEINSKSEEDMSTDDEENDDDVGEEDEGYEEPVSKELSSETTDAAGKSQVKKHVVFDDDETFENLPVLTSDAARKTPVEDTDESDSDSAPEEESISLGKDIFEEENVKMKEEIMKLKKQVKEARRLKHEKNREQQQKKRERLQKLEKTRLPADLLDAIEKEEKETKNAITTEPKGKRKTFEDDDLSDTEQFSEAVDDDNHITLDRGVRVRAVEQELKKTKTIISIAKDFRQKALYQRKFPRMSSVAQRQMLVKQEKSGKNTLVS